MPISTPRRWRLTTPSASAAAASCTVPSPHMRRRMRITAIDVHWLRLPLPPQAADAMTDLSHWDVIAVRIATDDGPVGWGYNCTIAEGSESLVTLLAKDLAPRFVGRDPFL